MDQDDDDASFTFTITVNGPASVIASKAAVTLNEEGEGNTSQLHHTIKLSHQLVRLPSLQLSSPTGDSHGIWRSNLYYNKLGHTKGYYRNCCE